MAIPEFERARGLHHIVPAVERVVQDITRTTEARKKPNPLWESIRAKFANFPLEITREIYKHEKKAAKRNNGQPVNSVAVAVEIKDPTPSDILEAARNSGTTPTGRVFRVIRPPKSV